jgi:TAT (twin-arginine translocation) pathway signal sequence
MDELTRRQILKSMAAAGAVAGLPEFTNAQLGVERSEEEKKSDRQRVMACGMTEAEADCWEMVAEAAGKFFRLPKLHPMDEAGVVQAIHVIQYKLMSRPAYRKYLELARGQKK